ncbi:hypothetical protein PUNSTDRAFT_124855 [Punctularia strigosozonata HHB-11173 SS5]|uniref:uncharacterized protein n=1 Tax=Punctularia strigosozonata (strain HHB-11173) TaxID=741275 RepID=UPI0004416FBF|nr:uncharacterized protein PUNSTDRAFT_124855 [Punctularia strigosozonata HHB-11173 SS5]EIN11561.1 hypothetical protein PUNSTDRAFT_124855 [Punctularia strigosozonata HHB-11173 SS5]
MDASARAGWSCVAASATPLTVFQPAAATLPVLARREPIYPVPGSWKEGLTPSQIESCTAREVMPGIRSDGVLTMRHPLITAFMARTNPTRDDPALKDHLMLALIATHAFYMPLHPAHELLWGHVHRSDTMAIVDRIFELFPHRMDADTRYEFGDEEGTVRMLRLVHERLWRLERKEPETYKRIIGEHPPPQFNSKKRTSHIYDPQWKPRQIGTRLAKDKQTTNPDPDSDSDSVLEPPRMRARKAPIQTRKRRKVAASSVSNVDSASRTVTPPSTKESLPTPSLPTPVSTPSASPALDLVAATKVEPGGAKRKKEQKETRPVRGSARIARALAKSAAAQLPTPAPSPASVPEPTLAPAAPRPSHARSISTTSTATAVSAASSTSSTATIAVPHPPPLLEGVVNWEEKVRLMVPDLPPLEVPVIQLPPDWPRKTGDAEPMDVDGAAQEPTSAPSRRSARAKHDSPKAKAAKARAASAVGAAVEARRAGTAKAATKAKAKAAAAAKVKAKAGVKAPQKAAASKTKKAAPASVMAGKA